jgi:hypothetical protein
VDHCRKSARRALTRPWSRDPSEPPRLDLPDGDDDLPGRALVGVGPEGCRGRAVIQYDRADDADALRPVIWCNRRLVVDAPWRTQRATAWVVVLPLPRCQRPTSREPARVARVYKITWGPFASWNQGIHDTPCHANVVARYRPWTPCRQAPYGHRNRQAPVIFQGSTYRHVSTGVDRP